MRLDATHRDGSMTVTIRQWARRVCAAAALLGTALALLAPGDASAQVVRPYTIRYQINTNGDIAHIGNMNMTCVASADCMGSVNLQVRSEVDVYIFYGFNDLNVLGGPITLTGSSKTTTSW